MLARLSEGHLILHRLAEDAAEAADDKRYDIIKHDYRNYALPGGHVRQVITTHKLLCHGIYECRQQTRLQPPSV